MKDSLLNLLVFLLVFVGSAVLLLTLYGLSMVLVPGGRGLIFSNPYASALLPSLLAAVLVALYRGVRRPGVFTVTWILLALAFVLLIGLSLPWIQKMPQVRAVDDSALIPGRFLPLDDGSLLLSNGAATVLIPTDQAPMSVSSLTQYDALNQRFVFSSGEPKALGSTGPERLYFEYTPALASLQTDFLALYSTLRQSSESDLVLFWFQAASISWLFLGFFFFFSLRTWPLVHVVLVLLLMRLAVMFLVYAFWGLPSLLELWVPSPSAAWAKAWGPLVLVDSAAATLFFMTLLSKPHRRQALE